VQSLNDTMFIRIQRLILLILAGALLAACGSVPQVAPTPTATPSLNANFWMDFPSVKAGDVQSANLVVHDLNGQPIQGATAVLEIHAKDYKREYYFQLTDADGRARVIVEVPPDEAGHVVLATVTVVDSSTNRWAKTETQFEVIPPTR
jgi:hypothetical protein